MQFNPQSFNERFANYESHRVVRAAKICNIWGESVVGIEPDSFSVTFDPKGKPTPKVGWWVLCYEDGYISFCPPDQFEKGYSRSKNETKFGFRGDDGGQVKHSGGAWATGDEPGVTLEQAKAIVAEKTAPKVTEDGIKAKIAKATYYSHEHMTICVLTLANGFFVVGKAAPADPSNYDAAVGERYAYEDAFKQIWHFEGYALREKLASAPMFRATSEVWALT